MTTTVHFRSQLFCLALLGFLTPASVSGQRLTEEKFRQLHAELQPSGYELWRKIPWETSVLEAQQLAARHDKPIFIWAMDGHPLGCT